MINEERFIRAILVNDQVSRVISLSQVSKTSEHRVDR
jgi:hypothetical protein